ncbi:MAG: WbqC family protein [Rhodospirillaceae bacterium]|jgi:hypothetical protein|nr:WbqC family protein [Rhodospirillaceae bacterium]MBT6118969.1 WbqC family protein [Rhodospirillaceae bacterium]
MGVTVSIHQPNYLPWPGYFRKIAQSDVFVFFDNVQMPIGKSLVTRNRVKTAQGTRWLTVPTHRDSSGASIAETPIALGNWSRKHLMTLQTAYAGSPALEAVLDILESALAADHRTIAALNVDLVVRLSGYVGIDSVRYLRASEMGLTTEGGASIPEILEKTGATAYLTGSGAGSMRYLDEETLAGHGIETLFVDSAFESYPQRHGNFEPDLSVLDVLLNCGPAQTLTRLRANAPHGSEKRP